MKEKEESRPPDQPLKAEIYSVSNISNAFSMDIELAMPADGDEAILEIGTYQGRQRDKGYGLRFVGGQTHVLELVRHTFRGSSIIDISKTASIFNDGQPHVVQWQRYSDGNMIVAVDGISIVNHNGDFAVSNINVFGKKE